MTRRWLLIAGALVHLGLGLPPLLGGNEFNLLTTIGLGPTGSGIFQSLVGLAGLDELWMMFD